MRKIIIFLLQKYQLLISPVIKNLFGGGCRFTPTCSQYTIEAVQKFGVLKGLILGTNRFLRCNPFGGSGYDPV